MRTPFTGDYFVSIYLIFHLSNPREAREELSKASNSKRGGIGERGENQDDNCNLKKRPRSDAVATESGTNKVAIEMSAIKKEKDLDVEDDNWQRDEIGAVENAAASEEVEEVASEEVHNEDLDHALAEAELGLTLDE